jgi:hypothetical protein
MSMRVSMSDVLAEIRAVNGRIDSMNAAVNGRLDAMNARIDTLIDSVAQLHHDLADHTRGRE